MTDKNLLSRTSLRSALMAISIIAVSASFGMPGNTSAAQSVDMRSRIASVEAESDECKAKNPSGMGLRLCAIEELETWDKELNVAYRLLMKDLGSDAAKAELRSVQRTWLTYRDAEFAFIESKYAQLSGSMYPRLIAMQKIPIVKNRVLRLSLHLTSREL